MMRRWHDRTILFSWTLCYLRPWHFHYLTLFHHLFYSSTSKHLFRTKPLFAHTDNSQTEHLYRTNDLHLRQISVEQKDEIGHVYDNNLVFIGTRLCSRFNRSFSSENYRYLFSSSRFLVGLRRRFRVLPACHAKQCSQNRLSQLSDSTKSPILHLPSQFLPRSSHGEVDRKIWRLEQPWALSRNRCIQLDTVSNMGYDVLGDDGNAWRNRRG